MGAVYWTGSAGDGNWSTPGNWNPSGVPGTSDDVTIGANGAATYDISSTATVASLTLDPGAMLTMSGGVLEVTGATSLAAGSSIIGSGTLTADGGVTGSGSIEASLGALEIDGSIGSGVTLSIDAVNAGDLLINGSVTTAQIGLTSGLQFLDIGASGNVTITTTEIVSGDANGGATLTLDAATSTLNDSSGIALQSGGTLQAAAGGTLNASIADDGTGVIDVTDGQYRRR